MSSSSSESLDVRAYPRVKVMIMDACPPLSAVYFPWRL